MKAAFALAGAAALFVAAPAVADTCQFTMAGAITEPGDFFGAPLQADFTVPCSPTPDTGDGSTYFELDGISGVFDGPGVTGNSGTGVGPITLGDIQFYTSASGGGFEVNNPADGDFGLFSLVGDQLFGGTLDNPTFLPGTYNFNSDFFYGGANATLVITQLSGPVPEPATWAMMLVGFCGIGAACRKKRRAIFASA